MNINGMDFEEWLEMKKNQKVDKFINCDYSLEELEQFRDERGFIDLSKAGLSYSIIESLIDARENRGTEYRVKNWVNFNGTKALIKGQANVIENNYFYYAELIVEEIAKQLGIETAHYDLIKLKLEDGHEILGVLSESMIDSDKEHLITLHDLIGDEPETDYIDDDYIEVTNYNFTIENLKKVLQNGIYDEETINNLITEYNKRLMFSLAIVDIDKHPENIAFISYTNDKGEWFLRLSPNFDSENSLLLDNPESMIEFYNEYPEHLVEEVNVAEPKIGIRGNYTLGSIWQDTFDLLQEDDELYNYYNNCIRGKINMDTILEKVEKRINAPLPNSVKVFVKQVFEARSNSIDKILEGEIYQQEYDEISMEELMGILEQMRISKCEILKAGEEIEGSIGETEHKENDRNDS